ncbi:MAG TPA: hypothetical protein VFV19_07215 [Candidatus Polarisedimenticolaceae bacterium]|nr:hypothetical protein [Candidatus Polarisedimenticolaceae bacterium]
MRVQVASLVLLLIASSAHADVTLSAKRVDPSTVELDWSPGSPYYQVYRSASPGAVAVNANMIAFTGLATYTDASASGGLLFYLVTDGHCAGDADCPATGNPCTQAVCSFGNCGVNNVPIGTAVPAQTAGDCETNVCDGNGGITQQPDNTDVPVDGNACTADLCTGGVPSNPPQADGTACSDGDGVSCQSGVCTPTLSVVRVGDGATALSTSAAAVFIDRFTINGASLATIALPTTFMASNQPCTLTGTATTEGELSRCTSGQCLVMACYGAMPGATNVSGSSSSTTNRVAVMIDGAGNIDTSTNTANGFNASNVRGAASVNGASIYLSGTSTGTTGGVWYIPRGTHNSVQILATPNSSRWLGIWGGQLYGDAASGAFDSVFTIGTGLPTTSGQTAAQLVGLPGSNGSPNGFAFFDLNPNVAGLDTLYIADDRGPAIGGGLQKWTTIDGLTWTTAAIFTNGITTGVRGLAATRMSDGTVWLFATTNDGKLVRFIDDGVNTNPAATLLSTAATNTAYRGVALSPH